MLAVLALAYQAAVEPLGTLQDDFLDEVSGVEVSRTNPGLLWVHNDSGDGPFLYGVGRDGRCRAVYRLANADAHDWEDIALGPDERGKGRHLFLGDIGDNKLKRPEHAIYRIAEPLLPKSLPKPDKDHPLEAKDVVVLRYRYPDGPHNAETLTANPRTGDLYVVTKSPDGVSEVFRFPRGKDGAFAKDEPQTLQLVATLRLAGEPLEGKLAEKSRLITGGDIAPDGRSMAFLTYTSIYRLRLPAGAASFDTAWSAIPERIAPLPKGHKFEGLCWEPDGRGLIVTSEGVGSPIERLPLP